ncbi:MAG: penicillin-insensitive murein endopeptidase [Symbiopectobacterium sp.]
MARNRTSSARYGTQATGAFSDGCYIVGAQQFPLESVNYQAIRVNQRRYFSSSGFAGAFITRLSANVKKKQTSGIVLVGDMGMPAGG